MSINTGQIIDDLLNNLELINSDDIPNIDLYMDQVTTFMEKHLSSSKRYEDDKVLTKTMINNYAKNKLLPPPEKKRYSKQHVIMLVFIYYFKNVMSISDIKTLLNPLANRYFDKTKGITLEDVYKEAYNLENSKKDDLKKELLACLDTANNTYTDYPEEDKEFLQLFSLISTLCYDIYVKKQLIEGIIDKISNESLDA